MKLIFFKGLPESIIDQKTGVEQNNPNTTYVSPAILQHLKIDQNVLTIIPNQHESLTDPVAMELMASVEEDQTDESNETCFLQQGENATVPARDDEGAVELLCESNEPQSNENQSPNSIAKRPQHEHIDIQKSLKKHASSAMKFRCFEINWGKVSDNILGQLNNLQAFKTSNPGCSIPGSLRLGRSDVSNLVNNIVDQLRTSDPRIKAETMEMVAKTVLRKFPCLEFTDDDGFGNGMSYVVIKQKMINRNTYLNRFRETSDKKLVVPNKGRNVHAGTLKNYWQHSSKDCQKELLSKLRRDEPNLLTDEFLANSQAYVRFKFSNATDLNQLFTEFPVLRRRNVLNFHFEKATGVNIMDFCKYYSMKRTKIIDYSNSTSQKFPHLPKDCSDIEVFKFLACIVGENLNDLILKKEVRMVLFFMVLILLTLVIVQKSTLEWNLQFRLYE